jgi:hypothetical protein
MKLSNSKISKELVALLKNGCNFKWRIDKRISLYFSFRHPKFLRYYHITDPKYCPDNCYETVYEVDRMNYPLADNVADFLPQNWNSRVDTAISRYAYQARLEDLVTSTE